MDLNQLKAILNPLTKFGQDELTFEVEGTTVTMRPLLPREEIKAQQYAATILAESQEEEALEEDDPLTRSAALRYFDQFRIEVIAYAIVAVDRVDLRGLEYVETGEILDNGVAVRIPKVQALRDIINNGWSRGMITICFSRYGDMISEIAERADKIARESLSDLDAEIERLEARLRAVQGERDRRAKGDPSVTEAQIKALVNAGKAMEEEVAGVVKMAQDNRLERERERAVQKVVESDPYPDEEEEDGNFPPPPVATPQPRRPAYPAAAPPPVTPPQEFVSSFADPEEDSQALAPDMERIRIARALAARAAREQSERDPLSQAKQEGTFQVGSKEIPVYRLPSAEISDRGKRSEPEKVSLDPDPRKNTKNPRFNPPK